MQLWCREADRRWGRHPIATGVRIGSGGDGRIVVGEGVTSTLATIIPYEEHAKARAALVSGACVGASVTLNGYPPLGITPLEDRDEIVIRGEAAGDPVRFVFAELEAACVVRFAGATAEREEIRCARCRQPLRSGDAAVRCPVCRRWYHEGQLASGKRRECWSYDALCGGCETSRAAMSWSPAAGDEGEENETEGGEVGSGNPPGPAPTEVAA